MTVTLAFKHAPEKGLISNIIANIIKWKTKSNYHHVEMIVKDKWISANPTEGAVYFHDLRVLSDKYTYVDINIHGNRVKKMIKFAKKQVGKKYDWIGIIFSQGINGDIEDKGKWFCSELVAEMLKMGGFMDKLPLDSNKYSPGDLYNIFID